MVFVADAKCSRDRANVKMQCGVEFFHGLLKDSLAADRPAIAHEHVEGKTDLAPDMWGSFSSCAPADNRRSGGLATRRRMPSCPTAWSTTRHCCSLFGVHRNEMRHVIAAAGSPLERVKHASTSCIRISGGNADTFQPLDRRQRTNRALFLHTGRDTAD